MNLGEKVSMQSSSKNHEKSSYKSAMDVFAVLYAETLSLR